jgi:methionyl-tRNA formyltransferase
LDKISFEINNLIRGLSPTAAWCILSDKTEEWTKIYDAKILFEDHLTTMLICTKKEMKIAVENGYIQILQFGKKKMTTSEF